MSIQRWKVGKVWDDPSPEGKYVLYTDHVAALAACEQRVLAEAPVSVFVKAFSDGKAVGYDIGLSAARDAVTALPCGQPGSSNRFWRDGALAAIDALRAIPAATPGGDDE